MARKTLRVEIPKNPEECIKLAGKVIAKHLADGAASPLTGIGMADMAQKQTVADQQNTLSGTLYSQAEKATQNRDLALGGDTSTDGTVRFSSRQCGIFSWESFAAMKRLCRIGASMS